jgi:hypothetical protein
LNYLNASKHHRSRSRQFGPHLRLGYLDAFCGEITPLLFDTIVVARHLEIRRNDSLRISLCRLTG